MTSQALIEYREWLVKLSAFWRNMGDNETATRPSVADQYYAYSQAYQKAIEKFDYIFTPRNHQKQ